MPETRFALFHTPGPRWRHDMPAFEQVGLNDHVAYFRLLHEAGKLSFGGPFVDAASGGMMVLATDVGEEEATTIAKDDPAVRGGLLGVRVRAWRQIFG